jgi:aminoglycoside phosphotransferase (APT) family kinase protein
VMHDDQMVIDVDTVLALIREQFPGWGSKPIERVASDGTVNAIFRIGTELVARFPLRREDPAVATASLNAEAAAMTELAECCPFPAPRPVAMGRPGMSYPMSWSIQTWLHGDVATPDGLAASTAFVEDLATLIGALRTAPVRGRRFNGEGRGGHLPEHDEWMNVCLEKSEGLLNVRPLRSAWARLRTLPVADPDVMSHRDLIPGNLLVRDERLVGVLDGGGFGPADPALDLVAAWHLLDRPAREALRSKLGSDDTQWARGAAWAFQQAMGLVWYYDHSNPGMAALGRSTLQRILEDPDLSL